MAISDIHKLQDMMAAKLSRTERDNLAIAGEEIGTVPFQASGSWNPRTMSRALGRGEPLGYLDRFSNILLVSVRDVATSRVVSKAKHCCRRRIGAPSPWQF